MKQKKNKLIKQIKDKIAESEFTTEDCNELAEKWISIADVDESGTIDLNELTEVVQKLDENFDIKKATEIFKSSLGEGNDELSKDEFGNALYECIKLMTADKEESN